jgi:glycosyltransferase involved in cell wall biosynthesis
MHEAREQRERVVVVTSSYPRFAADPSGHFVAAEVRELRAAGHEVLVIAARPAPSRKDECERDASVCWIAAGDAFGWPGVVSRVRQRPSRLVGVLRFVRGAARELERLGPVDRVIAHFVLPSAWPVLACSRVHAANVEIVAHGSDARLFAVLPAPLRHAIARTFSRRGARIRCTSPELRRVLEGALGGDFHGAIRVAASPVSVEGAPTRERAREGLGIERATRLLVIVGRLVRSKRVDVALRALALVPDTRVVVVGDGPERAELEHAFPYATFAGQLGRDEALTYIAAADAVISASQKEGSPSVAREARLLGTPLVAVEAGDLVERYAQDDAVIVIDV